MTGEGEIHFEIEIGEKERERLTSIFFLFQMTKYSRLRLGVEDSAVRPVSLSMSR